MYHIKDDQRSIISCELIFEGLAKLIQEQEFGTITVTDLAEAAGVGRATFYRHFNSIEDVLWMRCDQVIEGLIDYLQTYRENHSDDTKATIPKLALRYYDQHSELVELLIKANRMHIFEQAHFKQFQPFKPMFTEYYELDDDYIDYMMALRISNLTKILILWVKSGKKHTPDELAENLHTIIGDRFALERWL